MKTLTSAQQALSEVMALYNKEMTDFEIMLWNKVIADHGDQAVVRALLKHCERSAFAPKPGDVLSLLRPGGDSSVAALEDLARMCRDVGPWADPKFHDLALARAVELLGGWVKVNEQLPDQSDRFAFEAYFRRFDALYKQAQAQLLTQGVGQQPMIRGLHSLQAVAREKRHRELAISLERGG